MQILNISQEKKESTIRLSADELVRLCNVLSAQEKYDDNLHYKLYGDLMIARDLCQYGHIDGFCFERITKCRSEIK